MKIRNILTGVMVATATVVALNLAPAKIQAATAPRCTVDKVSLADWHKSFTLRDNVATATFHVSGKDCTTPVTLASWKAVVPGSQGVAGQTLYSYTTGNFGPGDGKLSVKFKPSCYWQLDLLEGANPKAPDGTANYDYQNGKIVDGGLIDFMVGGTTSCAAKPPVVTPPTAPTPPKTVVTANKLPDTGTNVFSLIATALGVSVVAGLGYQLYQKRSLKNA